MEPKKKSLPQLRLYRAYLSMICTKEGYIYEGMENKLKNVVCDAMHDKVKEEFLPRKYIRSKIDRRKKLKLPGSTKNMFIDEFTKFLQDLRKKHPYLPDPTDNGNLLEFMDRYYFQ